MKDILNEAIAVLKAGGIILYPTDTIWGIGCDASNEKAVQKIIDLKKRSDEKSFVVLVNSESMLERYVKVVPEIAWQLVAISEKPLTIIYPDAFGIAKNAVAADKSIAMRLVKHDFCTQLIQRLNRGIISTSANISGEASPLSFDKVSTEIKQGVDFIVPSSCEGITTKSPSSILKLALNGEFSIIRK